MRKKYLLHNIEVLEKLMFQASIEICVNKKNCKLVLDDELIGPLLVMLRINVK